MVGIVAVCPVTFVMNLGRIIRIKIVVLCVQNASIIGCSVTIGHSNSIFVVRSSPLLITKHLARIIHCNMVASLLDKVCDEGKRDWNFIRMSREYLVSA